MKHGCWVSYEDTGYLVSFVEEDGWVGWFVNIQNWLHKVDDAQC